MTFEGIEDACIFCGRRDLKYLIYKTDGGEDDHAVKCPHCGTEEFFEWPTGEEP